MHVLVIGGTQFIGKHITHLLLKNGHTVTHFNRGKSNAGAFPNVETVIGDRDHDLGKLDGRRFDWILDMCGYTKQSVIKSANRTDLADRYCYISTISVFAKPFPDTIGEDSPLGALENEETEVVDAETYGPLKAVCEREVLARWGDRAFLPRPGVVVGPDDPTDRFTYWVRRFAAGGDVLVPRATGEPIPMVDARDLATVVVRGMEDQASGTAICVTPECTMDSIVEACLAQIPNPGRPVYADRDWLIEQGITLWSDLPLWSASARPAFDSNRALALGMPTTPMAQTVRDTYEWMMRLPKEHEWRAGINDDRHAELLQKLAARA